MKKIINNGLLLLFAIVCIAYPIYTLIIRPGFFHGPFAAKANHAMYVELAIWLFFMIIGIKWRNLNWIFGLVILFSYAHAMLFPMLLAIGYTGLTYFVGEFFCNKMNMETQKGLHLGSYFIGMIILTILYAILSLFKIGSIRNLQIVDGVLLIALGVWYIRKNGKPIQRWWNRCSVSRNVYAKVVVLCCFVFLMIGRANISIDVDSAWYGLRSAFVLDNKTGIYEDLKLVGCVYTYPKGYETYQLPLSGFSSHGYVYAGNILMAIMILVVVYRICRFFLNSERAMWGVILTASIPGIMNMGITAKPDVMTLLVQTLQIYYSILFLKEKNRIYLGWIGATYIYAQTLKPTAVIFSTTILIAFMFVALVYRLKLHLNKESVVLWLLSIIDLAFIWYRTYILTGIPATSVWGRLFRTLGMSEKYPYASGQISQFRACGLFSKDIIQATLVRFKEFFFAPNSADTDHIILAWGSTLCIFLIIVTLFGAIINGKNTIRILKKNATACFLGLLMVGEFAGCLLCLWVLSKPDGNYFMLFYCVTAMIGVIYIQHTLVQQRIFLSNVITIVFLAFIPVNIVLSGCGNWAWASSFYPIDWVNRGFANHRQDTKRVWKEKGCDEIYDIMVSSASNKVYALAVHPDVELIPCVIESEQDVSFWGNAELTATVENFKEFVDYEEYDYIFISSEYVSPESGAYVYIDYLIDQGMVSDATTENGFILLEMGSSDSTQKNEEIKKKFYSVCGQI